MAKRSREQDAAGSTDAAHPILSLQEDLLSLIFSKLDVAERARASCVCPRWRKAALHPPHSTELSLCVVRDLDYESEDSDVPKSDGVRVLPAEAAAVLRGPLCRGLQRLRLDLHHGNALAPLSTIGSALPATLLALRLGGYGIGYQASLCASVLTALDLENTAPLLEDLEFGEISFELAELKFRHPALKRLCIRLDFHPCSELAPVLERLPRLRLLGSLIFNKSPEAAPDSPPSALAALADAGIRAERLEVWGAAPDGQIARLLQRGSVLVLDHGSSLPGGKDWVLAAGLSELLLEDCAVDSALFEALLCRTSTHAPGLGKLVLKSFDAVPPRDVVSALGRVQGGTQIELEIAPHMHGRAWLKRDVLASLARTLATVPALHRSVHVALHKDVARLLQPVARDDFAAYRRARVAALRGMGAAGRRLLAEQGYDRELG